MSCTHEWFHFGWEPRPPQVGPLGSKSLTVGDSAPARRDCPLLHLGIGRAHSRTEIIALIHNNDAAIASQSTGEILAQFTLDPTAATNEKTDEPPSSGVHPFAMS